MRQILFIIFRGRIWGSNLQADFFGALFVNTTCGHGLQHEWALTWSYTNDAMPEAYWQVCCRGPGLNSMLLMPTADRYWLPKRGLVWLCWWLPWTACWQVESVRHIQRFETPHHDALKKSDRVYMSWLEIGPFLQIYFSAIYMLCLSYAFSFPSELTVRTLLPIPSSSLFNSLLCQVFTPTVAPLFLCLIIQLVTVSWFQSLSRKA